MKLSGEYGIPAGLTHTKVINTGFFLSLCLVALDGKLLALYVSLLLSGAPH